MEQLGSYEKNSLLVHNPMIPRLHALYKDHKPLSDPSPKKRPIADNINAPNSKVAKWLLKEFKGLPKPFNLSVKNSIEFVEKLKVLDIENDEIMVSFDVSSLYPSVPIKESIEHTEDWLKKHRDNLVDIEQHNNHIQ